MQIATSPADTPLVRSAGRDVLSLALIDARNHTLRLFEVLQAAIDAARKSRQHPKAETLLAESPVWLLGHIGWFQELWIARNVQRQRGDRGNGHAPRLASIEPQADAWYDPRQSTAAERWRLALPDAEATRHYLLETLDTTLELLETADEDDAALYFYRLALLREDRCGEAFAAMLQALDFAGNGSHAKAMQALLPPPAPRALRSPLLFPAGPFTLGLPRAGFAFDVEQDAHVVLVPEFEIDAQAVAWSQYAEFVEDGGYDESRWWSPAGRDWLARTGRRAPRHVEQMRNGVVAHRYGQAQRMPMSQPVVHVGCHEAEAWCRWAGRRLPTEVEWELAASKGESRGFRWGEVWEWTASALSPYPGFVPGPTSDAVQRFGVHQAVRGASFATRTRCRHPKYRGSALPERDDFFVGFRSCAL